MTARSDREAYERLLEEIESDLLQRDALLQRQANLAAQLDEASVLKKLIGRAGRHPHRHTVERKLILGLAKEFLQAFESTPLVLNSPVEDMGEGVPEGRLPPTKKTLPKRRRALARSWRDIPEDLQLLLGQLALASQVDALAFSVNLGSDLLRRLASRSLPQMRDEIRNRLSRAFNAQFGRPIPFVVVLERDAGGRLHAHGVLALSGADTARAEIALRKAAGEWGAARPEKQAHVKLIYDAAGWADYIVKDLRRMDPQLQGALVGWSQPMKKLAKEFHARLRQWAIDNRSAIPVEHSFHFVVGLLGLHPLAIDNALKDLRSKSVGATEQYQHGSRAHLRGD